MAASDAVVACTVVTRNRLAHARVLAESFARHHPAGAFSVLVVDDPDGRVGEEELFEVLRPTDLGLSPRSFHDLALLFTPLELSGALKSRVLRVLLDRGHRAVFHLDSDLWLLAPIGDLQPEDVGSPIVLTPHRTQPLPLDGRDISERAIGLAGGINTGFLAVSQEGRAFLDWWWELLVEQSLLPREASQLTEQHYVDLVPLHFDSAVLRDPAVNVAFWNADACRVEWTGLRYEVGGRPLRCFHFSGFDPERPWLLSRHQGHRPRVLLSEHPGLARLCAEYAQALLRQGFRAASAVPYRYERLPNGLEIDERVRRLYAEALEQDAEPPPNPFDPKQPEALTEWLNQPIDPSGVSRYLLRLRAERPLSRLAFPDLAGEDGPRYLDWIREHGRESEHLPSPLVPEPGRPLRRPATVGKENLSPGVNVIGYLEAEAGVGEAARQTVAALEAAGIPSATVDYRGIRSRQRHAFHADGLEAARYDVNLLCLNADGTEAFRRNAGPEIFRDRYSIGLWWWEIEQFPERFRGALDLVDEVWTGSELARAAIAAATSKPVLAFPTPVLVRDVAPVPRSELELDDGFLFLFVYDFFSVFRRKNPLALVEAFRRAFAPGEGPALLLKSVNGADRIDELEELRAAAADRRDVRVLDGYLDPHEKDALMATCDCYVSLHRSEGFGLTIAEAMARGKPVIATAYGGNLEFMTAENSHLVPYRLVPVGGEASPYPPDAAWAEPDVDAAARLMRRVFEHRDEAAEKGRQARRDILERHSPERAGAFMRRRLDEIRAVRTEASEQPAAEPAPGEKPPPPDGLQRAVGWLARGPVNTWDAPSRLGAAGRLARKAFRRTLRPYEIRQRELETAVVETLEEDRHRIVVLEESVAELRDRLDRL